VVFAAASAFGRLGSPLGKALAPQPFRKDLSDHGVVFSQSGSIFKLEGVLGVGGLSVVYRAVRLADGKVVAVKLARRDKDDAAVRLVEHEARILARLKQEHIISVLEYGHTADGDPYLVVPFLPGQSLDKLIRANSDGLERARVLSIIEQVASALGYAHAQNIIHRDVKPSNIMVTCLGGFDWVHLLDFGIALDTWVSEEKGQAGGSLFYVAPEQLMGDECTVATDVYQVALVAYEALTGRLPFEPTFAGAVAYRRDGAPLPGPELPGAPVLPAGVREVLEQALEREPYRRPATIMIFLQQLNQSMLRTLSE
jgi:serine/threonine protein kinase